MKPPAGYTAEELERDNPYNQWMFENEEHLEEEEDPDEDPTICVACNGSGEGQYDGTKCSTCKGKGVS